MKKLTPYFSRQGFSLVEVILASSIFALLVSVLVGAVVFGRESSATAGKQTRARLFAEEGVEALRNMRDTSFQSLAPGTFGLATSSNHWTLSGSSDAKDGFIRQIQIANIDAWTKVATVTVTWQQTIQRTGKVEIAERFTNWRTAGWRLPTQIAVLNNAGTQNGFKVKVQGNYAYAVLNNANPDFIVVNISNPAAPTLAGSVNLSGVVTNLVVSGNYAYVSSQSDAQELQVIDISNPAAPTLVGSFNATGTANASGIAFAGTIVYMVRASSANDELLLIDVAVPTAPTLISSLNLGADAIEIDIVGNDALISSASNSQELQVVNISNPSSPVLIGSLNLPGSTDTFTVSGYGTTAYIGQGTQLHVINIANPSIPVLQASFNAGGTINDLVIGNNGTYVFLATASGAQELQIVDATIPVSPVLVGSVNASDVLQGVAYSAEKDRIFTIGNFDTAEFNIFAPEE